jgi:hypothetical protein
MAVAGIRFGGNHSFPWGARTSCSRSSFLPLGNDPEVFGQHAGIGGFALSRIISFALRLALVPLRQLPMALRGALDPSRRLAAVRSSSARRSKYSE